MPRLKPIRPSEADAEARRLLESVHADLGMIPNLMRTMASSSVVLEAHQALDAALGKGRLSARLRQQLALTVAEASRCRYCLAAHAAVGKSAGLSDEAISDGRRGRSPNSSVDAALRFARQVVAKRGRVNDADVDRVRRAGFGDGEIGEIVANVAASLFTNYFNHVADTEIDFPTLADLEPGTDGDSPATVPREV